MSFLLDPESLERRDLTRPDVWLPVLDRSGRSVVYWSGTLVSDDGRTWALGTGQLVLDRWSTGVPAPVRPGAPNAAVSTDAPASTPIPVGPSGAPTTLVPGGKAAFEASFDPSGSHLAVWVGETLEDEIGRLHLVVLDPQTGAIATGSPLEGAAALRRFSIDKGRLAWVTPSGQNGQESAVLVLAWHGDEFGEVQTEPASDLYLP